MASYSNQKRAKNADTPENTSRYYLTNSKLLPEVIFAKEKGKVTDKLAEMLMMLTRRYAQRPCFSGYTYKEDMISEALANLCQNALKFKPEKSSNPFAFYTTCINNSFLQFLNVEKKHRKIRDKLLIDMGENPSYNFSEEYKSQQTGEFSSELQDLKLQIEEAHQNVKKDAEYAAAAVVKAAKQAAEDAGIEYEPVEFIVEEIPNADVEEILIIDTLVEFDEE